MAANDDVLIIGKLEDDALRTSIEELVNYVGNQTSVMASKFVTSMDLMKGAMKDFAVTQKVSVDLMKESWRTMSASFDAMFEAEKTSSGGSKGSGKATYADNTIGALEQEIALLEKERKDLELNTDELRNQNKEIEKQRKLLSEQKGLNTQAEAAKKIRKELGDAMTMPAKSLGDAQSKLSELERLQRKYAGKTQLSVQQQNRLTTAIQNTKEKIDKLTSTKPRSLNDVLGMDENSFEAISKKMSALKKLSWADPAEQKRITDEYQRLRLEQNKLLATNAKMARSNNYLAQSFGYIRNRIVYALTLGAITSFTKKIYEIRGQYELLERSLGVLVNSFERGTQVFRELNAMAIESPFTLMELASGAKQLTAYNFAAEEVVDTTRRLADISAALGVPMERLVYNLGQIRAQTVLNARDARDFANAGLPVVKMLADYYTELEGKVVSTGEVYSRMSKKMVSYSDVMTVVNKATDEGGKFFEFQAKQAQTLRVQMANLTLAYNNMLNEMGEGNQALLAFPIKSLKILLQNWESINRVIKNLALSFGLLKVGQILALKSLTGMTWGMATATIAGNALTSTIARLTVATKALFMNPWTWVFAGVFAFTDLIGKIRANIAEIDALNDEIRKTATEASQANLDFLNNKGNKATRELAKENKLSTEEADKAWASIEEHLKTSSDAAGLFLAELYDIANVNERVAKGFDYVERIQHAQAAMKDLGDKTIKITQDKGWFGMFGEGLVSDLKDLREELEGIGKTADIFGEEGKVNADIGSRWAEYRDELEVTAESINNFIKEHNITDPLQIQEILGRVKAVIKSRNPEIKGELEALFDVTLDKRISYMTNGAIDENTSLWKMFMERLKHNSSSAFQDVTTDIYNESSKLSDKQQEAVDENLEYFKNTMPFYYNSVKEMVEDASKLKIQIGLAFNVQQLTSFQKQVQDRIKASNAGLDFGNKTMWGTQNDDLQSWVSQQQKAIKDLGEENKLYAKDNTEWSKAQIEANDTEIKQRKNLLDLFHQSYVADKKNKGGAKKDVLGEALAKEIQLVTDIRKRFDEYKKEGVDAQTALVKATNEYGLSLKNVKATLGKYGILGLEGEDVSKMEMRDLVARFEEMKRLASLHGNVKGVEALEKAIAALNVEITKVDYKRVVDGLNNELGKLKEEYDLGIELDANPELGSMFADYFGINIDELPKDYEQALRLAQKRISTMLSESPDVGIASIDMEKLMNKKEFDAWVEGLGKDANSELIKKINEIRSWLYKVRSDETKSQMQEWDKLLEKYAEYEEKIKKIDEETEKERKAAQAKGAPQWLLDAIDNMNKQKKAQAAFEEFQKRPEWLIATGDLAGMTNESLQGLVQTLEDFKKKGNLTEKQTKQINKALVALHKQIRKGNPFHAIADAMDEANMRASVYDEKLEETSNLIDGYMSRLSDLSDDEKKKLKELIDEYNKLLKLKERDSKVDASTIVKGINDAIDAAKQATTIFTDMMDALGGTNGSLAAKRINQIVGVLEKGGQGAAIGAQIGKGYGAIIGAVAGTLSGLVTTFWDEWSGNASITDAVNESVNAVKDLENAYKRLSYAAEQYYGAASIASKETTKSLKEMQLVELRRQLQLEQSRDSKNRDEERIRELRSEIVDLEQEIANATKETINDLLSISSHADFFESLISEMVSAFKEGEDAMEVFEKKWASMIDSMVTKIILGQVLQHWVNTVEEGAQSIVEKYTGDNAKEISELESKIEKIESSDAYDAVKYIMDNESDAWNRIAKQLGLDGLDWRDPRIWSQVDTIRNMYIEMLKKQLSYANSQSSNLSINATEELLDYYTQAGEEFKERYAQAIIDRISGYYTFGQDAASNQLSALQQGIQGITETTAGAIEAYMNGVSQQVYLQSDYLRQITEILTVSSDIADDAKIASLSMILLQLQNSYQIQLAIQSRLDGWSSDNDRAIRVEMV